MALITEAPVNHSEIALQLFEKAFIAFQVKYIFRHDFKN